MKSLVNFDTFEKMPCYSKEVWRFSVVKGKMVKKKTGIKIKFSQLNDKSFYFSDELFLSPLDIKT